MTIIFYLLSLEGEKVLGWWCVDSHPLSEWPLAGWATVARQPQKGIVHLQKQQLWTFQCWFVWTFRANTVRDTDNNAGDFLS